MDLSKEYAELPGRTDNHARYTDVPLIHVLGDFRPPLVGLLNMLTPAERTTRSLCRKVPFLYQRATKVRKRALYERDILRVTEVKIVDDGLSKTLPSTLATVLFEVRTCSHSHSDRPFLILRPVTATGVPGVLNGLITTIIERRKRRFGGHHNVSASSSSSLASRNR